MRVKKFFLLIFGCIFALVCLAFADVLISKSYQSSHVLLDSAGGKIASANYQSRSSIGQKFVGEAKSDFYRNLSGYIRLSEEKATVTGIRVISTLPKNNGYFVIGEDTKIEMKFNKHMSSSTMNTANISITDEDNTGLTLNKDDIVYVSSVTSVTTVTPPSLNHCTRYTVEVSTNVEDVYGNSLPKSESFSFTTLIREKETGEVIVEHKAGVVKIGSPAETFPGEGKGWYINLTKIDLKKRDISPPRILRCYGVDKEDKQGDINHLNRSVTISIPYPSDTKDKRNLRLYFYNKDIGRWELVKGSGDTKPDDGDDSVTGEVSITNTEYCVRAFAMGGLIEKYSNYPNPFKAGKQETTIIYDLEENAKVTISIYDLLGQLVRRIEIPKGTPERGEQGTNKVPWNGKNERGRVVANGGYYCVVEADTETGKHMKKARKIMVIK
ncbi:hypothetical protein ES705_19651 [subsurface metagenome]